MTASRNHCSEAALSFASRKLGRDDEDGVMKTRSLSVAKTNSTRLYFAIAATALALLAIPHWAYAQGIVGGAERGARQGGRAAGPVGAVVGGAIGAGVGGAVGAVDGVLGIPNAGYRGYRCRGYYNRYGRFRCYR
jgi:hypothetical protein